MHSIARSSTGLSTDYSLITTISEMLGKSLIFLACLVAYAACQTYSALKYSDCGSTNVKITRLTYSPMPILHPAPGRLSVAMEASERISGVVKADVKIVRTVNKIKLPVGCYIHQGVQYGSCSYADLCALIKRVFTYDSSNCPEQLTQYGINCECPVSLNKNNLDVDLDVNIPQAPEFANWLSVGDFDINLKASVGKINGCYDFAFSVKPK